MNRKKHHEMVLRDISRKNIKKYCYMHGDNPKKYRWKSGIGFPITAIAVKNPKAVECVRSPKDIRSIRFLLDCVPTTRFDGGNGPTEFDVEGQKSTTFDITDEVYETYRSWLRMFT